MALRSQLAISTTHFNTKPIGDFKDLIIKKARDQFIL